MSDSEDNGLIISKHECHTQDYTYDPIIEDSLVICSVRCLRNYPL